MKSGLLPFALAKARVPSLLPFALAKARVPSLLLWQKGQKGQKQEPNHYPFGFAFVPLFHHVFTIGW
jgi:hypothetical protein